MGGSFATTLPADPGGLTGSRCSSYETNSCLDKGMLRGSWLSAGGRTNWMEPEPFRAFEKKNSDSESQSDGGSRYKGERKRGGRVKRLREDERKPVRLHLPRNF